MGIGAGPAAGFDPAETSIRDRPRRRWRSRSGRLQNGAGIARGYEEKGLESALYERPWPSQPWCLYAGESQRIIAMVRSAPPAGQGRWSVRLIAEEAVKRKWVSRMGRETIPILLRRHDLKPWGKKCGAGGTGGGIHPAPRGDF